MKILFTFILVAILLGRLAAQDTTYIQNPQFAIIWLPAVGAMYAEKGCWAYYDNGAKENLSQSLNLPAQVNRFKTFENEDIVRSCEFKILSYMYSKGYELLANSYDAALQSNQFYFRHK